MIRSLSDILRSTAANDLQSSASFSSRKNPQCIPVNTLPVFPGLRPRSSPRLLRLITKHNVGQAPRSRPILHSEIHPAVDGAKPIGHTRGRRVRYCALIGFFIIVELSIATSFPAVAEDRVSPTLLTEVVNQQADQLALIDSDEGARTLFMTKVGPALGLRDAAGALGAKRLSSKLVKEFGVAELSQSVHELMAALATWQFADSIRHEAQPSPAALSLSAARQEWLRGHNRTASLSDLLRLTGEDQTLRTSQATSPPRNTELLLAAERTVFESSQLATAAWWEIYGWKDRVRQARGRARLCGTWQWIIHNHQMHGEQKTTIIFPPAGQTSANAATPAETIILGDAIYLRWEQNGQIQEDSLLFIKDNTKIEGSFMNSTGGWGPITAKRTAPCQQ